MKTRNHNLQPTFSLFSFLLFLGLLCPVGSFAQAVNNQIKDVVMPSPNAASLGKFGDIPVSLHTGTTSVGVPIHTVQDGSLSVPIGLNYHSGGIRVNEISSWVGTGWSLQAGGMISRSVQGKADERDNGYMTIGQNISVVPTPVTLNPLNECVAYNNSVNGSDLSNFTLGLNSGVHDSEPDIFSFSIGGYNGKFYIDADKDYDNQINGKVILVPKQDIKIDYVLTGNSSNIMRFSKFIMTMPDGTKYEFGDIGDGNPAIEVTKPYLAQSERYTSGWYLKRITSFDNAHSIDLKYTVEKLRQSSRPSFGASVGNVLSTPNSYLESVTDILGYRLDSIRNSTYTDIVTFVKGVQRTDVKEVPGAQAAENPVRLAAVKIESGTYCKQFALNQDYFEDNSPYKSGQTAADTRLRLNSVQESSCNNSVAAAELPAPYSFTYYGNANSLPHKLSSAIDHWGYYNGAHSNPIAGLNIPFTRLRYQNLANVWVDDNKGKSNRETNENYMKLGALQTITYPTGGSSTLEYEANDYWETEGSKTMTDVGNMGISWPTGYFSESPGFQETSTSVFKTFSDINRAYFKWDYKKATNYNPSMANTSNNPSIVTLSVYVGNSTTLACPAMSIGNSSNDTPHYNLTDALINLFPCLQSNVSYRFELRLRNAASQVFFQEEITGDPYNRKVGGLRVKSVTSSNGIDNTKNITKNYQYTKWTTVSSGKLYQKPVYGYVFDNVIAACEPTINTTGNRFKNHYWADQSIVPLSSFEGGHIGYSQVTETINQASTTYTFHCEEPEPFTGLPIAPQKPRIGTGEVWTKTQVNNATNDIVGEETNTPKNDPYEVGQGTFVNYKPYSFNSANINLSGPSQLLTNPLNTLSIAPADANTHKSYSVNTYSFHTFIPAGGIGGNTPITISFWKKYTIRTKAYRLDNVVSIQDGISTTMSYAYDSQNRFLAPIEVMTSNSDGKTVSSKTYYAHNLPSNHPNINEKNALIAKNMVGIPYQTEEYINGIFKGGTQIQISVPLLQPYQSWSFNRDLTKKSLMTIHEFDRGLPKTMVRGNSETWEIYNWDNKKRLTSKTFGGLTWAIEYNGNSNIVNKMTDENGIATKYTYDGLWRLKTTSGKLDASGMNPRITTTYNYEYKLNGVPCNKVSTTTTFADSPIPLSSSQFLDGLGRGFAGTKWNYTPNNQHQTSFITFDNQGRQDRAYQPTQTSGTGCPTEPSNTPFVRTEYESSPLSRPIKQIAEDGKFMTTAYGTNTVDEVLKFNTTTNTEYTNAVSVNGAYAADELYKTTITNENGKQTCVFKDKLGRVILTRKKIGNDNVDTYNVYDDWGSLIMVIPPDAISGTTINQNLTFRYKYDVQNRLCEKIIPGAEPQRFYYDSRDLVVLTQDGNQRAKNPNIYYATVYDNLGRKVETGWIWTNNPVASAAAATSDRNTYAWSELGDLYYYASTGNRPTGVRGRPVGTTKPTDEIFIWDNFSYDNWGQMTSRGRGMLTGQANWRDISYNDAGKITQQIDFLNGMNGRNVWLTNKYDYDHALRQTYHHNNLWYPNSLKNYDWVSLSKTNYNHLDQVVEKNLGSNRWNDNTFLQSIDYSYNVRGWLTAINQVNLTRQNMKVVTKNGMITEVPDGTYSPNLYGNDQKGDLFGQVINYGNNESLDPNLPTPTPQYNGNISQTLWQVSGREQQAYNYTYDDLDRLINAQYYDLERDLGGVQLVSDNKFGESLTYDKRGNILTLQRNGLTAPCTTTTGYVCGTFGQIDNLNYTVNDKNQITKIVDASNATKGFKYGNSGQTTDYTYDANGNMTSDKNKGITNIVYNFLNLPQTITFTNNRRIEFVYASTGAKLRKTVFDNGVETTFDYLEEAEYKNGVLQRVAHAEGALLLEQCTNCTNDPFLESNSNGIAMKWVYEYNMKDHLGNTRVSFADRDNDWQINVGTEVSQINHYYPFGLNMEGNWNGAQGANKYQYNGKELNDDFGLGWNDYGARFYDAASGRWVTVDLLAEKFINLSPYNYVANNPIKSIDPDGKDIIILYKSAGIALSFTYRTDGTLKFPKGYDGALPTYVSTTKAKFDALLAQGGVVAEVVNDLIALGRNHTFSNAHSPNPPEDAKGSYSTELANGDTWTRYVPNIDKANGLTFSQEEILGHEVKHDYNYRYKIDNTNKTTIAPEIDKAGNNIIVRGEEVDAVNFQNIIIDNINAANASNKGYVPIPRQTTYTGGTIPNLEPTIRPKPQEQPKPELPKKQD